MHSFKQEMDVIYQASLKESMLVFPNSRNKVEKIGSNLNQRAETDMQNLVRILFIMPLYLNKRDYSLKNSQRKSRT